MKKMTGKNTLMLFLTAFIWGTAFVAQSVGMDYIGPFTFTCVRSLIGGIFLIPCICFLDKWRAKNDGAERQKKADRKEEKKNVPPTKYSWKQKGQVLLVRQIWTY